MSNSLEDAVSIFKEFYPALKAAMDREQKAWEAYSKVGIGKITPAMVKERQEASSSLNKEWEQFKIHVGWAKPRQ